MLELSDRPAPNLNGGQQQRGALARAIFAEPSVLLLDEPLSNLDAKLREQMRRDLVSLQRELGHSTIYVTHDQEEALALSHRIALMRNGEIIEEGKLVDMYQQPQHPFTAAFLGAANFVNCKAIRPHLDPHGRDKHDARDAACVLCGQIGRNPAADERHVPKVKFFQGIQVDVNEVVDGVHPEGQA